MPGKILIVDDEKDMLTVLQRFIQEETQHEVVTETDPLKALERFKADPFDLVVTDLKMPRMNGIALLEGIKAAGPDVSVIVMTAYGTIETAVEAIRRGAHDYITKPFRRERIIVSIDKAMKWREVVRENEALRRALAEKEGFSGLIGTSPVMKRIFERIRQVAPTTATVLITGPSGTGKELLARAVHKDSLRSAKPFITLNCTAIPEQVIESELFGHVKGAFTGAWRDKRGLVEEAHEGTLFLDEIGDLNPQMQTKLLRLLQEGEFRPVGGITTKKADIRFVAATNHNLKEAIRERAFREDLFYRLNVVQFELPPLKERREDIPLLSLHFLNRYARANRKDIRDISPAAMRALLVQEYAGNVRELENIIERGVVFCRTQTLEPRDLFPDGDETLGPQGEEPAARLPFREARERVIKRFQRDYISLLLRETGGNVSRAAEMAGIQRQYLHRLIKEAGVSAEEFKDPA